VERHVVSTGQSYSGREFDEMDTEAQRKACQTAKLFSRVEPAHKSKIVDYLQKDGAVSAMVRRGRYPWWF
jgi:Ca2+ transporting ATPase